MGHSNCHFSGESWEAERVLLHLSSAVAARQVGWERSDRSWAPGVVFQNPPCSGWKFWCEPHEQRDSWQAGRWQTHNAVLDGQMPASPLARLAQVPSPSSWDPDLPLKQRRGQCPLGGATATGSPTCLWPIRDCPHAHWHQTDPCVSAWPVCVFSSGNGCASDPVVTRRWKCHHWSCLGMFVWSYSVTRCQVRWSLQAGTLLGHWISILPALAAAQNYHNLAFHRLLINMS